MLGFSSELSTIALRLVWVSAIWHFFLRCGETLVRILVLFDDTGSTFIVAIWLLISGNAWVGFVRNNHVKNSWRWMKNRKIIRHLKSHVFIEFSFWFSFFIESWKKEAMDDWNCNVPRKTHGLMSYRQFVR